MECIVTTVLLVIIAVLTIAHAFIHQNKSGKVINKVPGPRIWPLLGNAPYLVGPPDFVGNPVKMGRRLLSDVQSAAPTDGKPSSPRRRRANFRVPRGTILNFTIFDLHRDANFWPQLRVYDPNRFLPNEKLKRHPYSFVPFGGGPRNCIGQKYAMLKLKAFVGLILHNFSVEPVTEVANMRMAPELVLRTANPLKVKFVPIR